MAVAQSDGVDEPFVPVGIAEGCSESDACRGTCALNRWFPADVLHGARREDPVAWGSARRAEGEEGGNDDGGSRDGDAGKHRGLPDTKPKNEAGASGQPGGGRPILVPPGDGLFARLEAKAGEDLADMPLRAVEREAQVISDFCVRPPFSHQGEDRQLARREAVLVPRLIVGRAVGHGINVPEPGAEKPTL